MSTETISMSCHSHSKKKGYLQLVDLHNGYSHGTTQYEEIIQSSGLQNTGAIKGIETVK